MTKRRMVLLQGKLFGAGLEAKCELVARQVSAASGGPYEDCAVVSSPALPDGEYTVFFEGYFATAKRMRGHWVTVSTPQHI